MRSPRRRNPTGIRTVEQIAADALASASVGSRGSSMHSGAGMSFSLLSAAAGRVQSRPGSPSRSSGCFVSLAPSLGRHALPVPGATIVRTDSELVAARAASAAVSAAAAAAAMGAAAAHHSEATTSLEDRLLSPFGVKQSELGTLPPHTDMPRALPHQSATRHVDSVGSLPEMADADWLGDVAQASPVRHDSRTAAPIAAGRRAATWAFRACLTEWALRMPGLQAAAAGEAAAGASAPGGRR